jgi:CRISPR-associated protein Cas1
LFSQQLAAVVKDAFALAREADAASQETAKSSEQVAATGSPVEVTQETKSGAAVLAGNPVLPEPAEEKAERGPRLENDHPNSSEGWVPLASPDRPAEMLPARMLNEFVYCPRLFYYEHVDGVFVESADTVRGKTLHKRVDKGSGAMPEAKKSDEAEDDRADGEGREAGAGSACRPAADEIHSRSVWLGSERLGVTAKMDLVEVTLDGSGGVAAVCPVDYKAGAPRAGEEGLELWDADRMQLGLQCLVLRDNGYRCDEGIIYYRATKQRVPLALTPELETWIIERIAAARRCAAGLRPAPLVDSPKCVRCSLAPVCLPDETRMLSIPTVETYSSSEIERDGANQSPITDEQSPSSPPRRLMAPREEKRALYLNTQGYRVGCHDGMLKIKEGRSAAKRAAETSEEQVAVSSGSDRLVDEVRLSDLCHVALFGNIQLSTQAVQRLCDADIPVTYFSMGGWFYGLTRGHGMKNVLVRMAQFRHAGDPAMCLRLAQQFVRGKIHNHRVLFMRNHVSPPERVKMRLGQAREDVLRTRSLEELLGTEGAAANEYFAQFGGLLREQADDDYLDGLAVEAPTNAETVARFSFDFTGRNRRPPVDPVNALLSLAYSLLAKECTLAAYAVGLDPYVGFYHQPRHGRPALALDVMEEFRPLIAESAVLTAINNRYLSTGDFVRAGKAVNLSVPGRRQFFQCFEQRMNTLITHPVFDYKVSYRRALELQFRILARVLTGEIPEYVPFMTR